METEEKVGIFEEKIQDYYLSCFPRDLRLLWESDKTHLQEVPLYKFNILSIYRRIRDDRLVTPGLLENCADKLIDMKLMYCYLTTTVWYFYRGTTVIVGNNELEKLNPNTISLLRGNHYKVYLISILAENMLDFLQLVFHGKIVDHRRGKWKKILQDMKGRGIDAINDDNIRILLTFEEKYRTAELHKFSSVRSFTAKQKWDHFQVEEGVIGRIISDLTAFFLHREA